MLAQNQYEIWFKRLLFVALLLNLVVIVLGAYVRLSHAGLGCPDWPGCYGEITWPQAAQEIISANDAYPDRPVEAEKAWKEMVHRYIAGVLVLVVIALLALVAVSRKLRWRMMFITSLLLGLILFQALLGMWTVTLKLKPIIVMLHLLGGLSVFALLIWMFLKTQFAHNIENIKVKLKWSLLIATILLVLQIALGGWLSANYAALACPDFPTCQLQWWPEMNVKEAFVLWREIGVDYEGGVLDNESRVAIHMFHRIMAVVVTMFFGFLLWKLFRINNARLTRLSILLSVCLFIQIALGITNIVAGLPIIVAVMHNGMAALLLAIMMCLNYFAWYLPSKLRY